MNTMKISARLICCEFALLFMGLVTLFGQIPAGQRIVVIDPGIDGIIETTINGDTLAGGERANPSRIYMLKEGGLYIMSSPIIFGSENDSTSTLIIVGEEGGNKPLVLTSPPDGAMATNLITGSLILKNLYWPAMALNRTGASLFALSGTYRRLEVEDFVCENVVGGDIFNLGGVNGEMSVYFRNCYFRDITKFSNPWNYSIMSRGNYKPIDTLWVENLTVANGGLVFLGNRSTVNFAFFNHNTIMNIPKHWLFMEQWKEAYFTNNILINCNWQGECPEMMLSQKPSQAESLVPVQSGVIDLMEPIPEYWEAGSGVGSRPAMEDVIWMASNNLHFTSPYLDKYYRGEFNDVGDYPISNIDWGISTSYGLDLPLPHPVENVPPRFFSAKTDSLINLYDGVKADNNYIQVDPEMVNNVISDQAGGDAFAAWARNDYGVAEEGEERPDILILAVGDYDPGTIPGPEGENSNGFSVVSELPEDFTYNAPLISTIDGRKLGALEWWDGGLDGWDSESELDWVKMYYEYGNLFRGTDPPPVSLFSIFPNPVKDILHIESGSELSSARLFDMTGRIVRQVNLHGSFSWELDISGLYKGIYFLKVEFVGGDRKSSKIIKE